MSKLPSLKPREVSKILIKAGFVEDTTKSSHRTYFHRINNKYTTVSFHPGAIPTGTLRAIVRQSGMTVDEFLTWRRKK